MLGLVLLFDLTSEIVAASERMTASVRGPTQN
jgi:hypothetical protein